MTDAPHAVERGAAGRMAGADMEKTQMKAGESAYATLFRAEALRRGYERPTLVGGVWCASAKSCPDWARDAPKAAGSGMRAIPGTDQQSIGRHVDRLLDGRA